LARYYALAEDGGYAVALWQSDDDTPCAERVCALMDKAQGVCLTSVGSAEATLIPCPVSRLYQEKQLADLRLLMAAQTPGVSCGVSSVGPLSRVPELLSEAEEALTLRFYGGRGSMNRRQGKIVWRQEPVPLPENPPMDRAGGEGDSWQAVEKWTRGVFDHLRGENPPYAPERVRALTLTLLRSLSTQLRRYLDEDDREIAAIIFDLEGKPVLPFLTDYQDALLNAYRLAWRRYFSAEGDALNNFAIRCCYYIEHHYQTNLRVQEMAAFFCITPNYFSHLFKKTMNVSFKQYLTNVRVEQARRLLEKGGMTASQVASKVGFTDYKYFHQVYRKETGRAPTPPPESKTREEES
jgi:AraC-like DNA-binding protein